jgi:hypothetical protein
MRHGGQTKQPQFPPARRRGYHLMGGSGPGKGGRAVSSPLVFLGRISLNDKTIPSDFFCFDHFQSTSRLT